MQKIIAWVLATRPKTFPIAWMPVFVGTALAYAQGAQIQWRLSILAFLSTLCIQIGTNLFNDAYDFKNGADTSERLGPQRVTQAGVFSPEAVKRAGILAFVIAFLLAIPLAFSGGLLIVILGLLALLAGYSYTGGKSPLGYLGLGDSLVFLFYGWVGVGGVYFLQTQRWDFVIWIAGMQIGCCAVLPMMVNQLRDYREDAQAGKRTLVVRWGLFFGKCLFLIECLLPFVVGYAWVFLGFSLAFLLPLPVLLGMIFLWRKLLKTESSPLYNQFLAQSVQWGFCFSLLLSCGLCIIPKINSILIP